MQSRKKILLLGGTSISRQIVYGAHELGLDVYVTDYHVESPCKSISEQSFMVSCTDIDAVCDLVEREKIDGVITGYADVLLPSYVKICEKANLPCYSNLSAIEITSNKAKFKKLCQEFGVPTIQDYSYEDVENDRVQYPIIIKPVDNSGARGIYICHNKKEFEQNYSLSLGYSPTKQVLIEAFINKKEATIFYYMHDGEIYLLGVADRHMLSFDSRFIKLPVGYTFPSINQNEFIKVQNDRIKVMFRSLGMKEGMAFIQAFNDNGRYVVYEMGYRLTGSLEHHLMGAVYNFDHLKAIISYAVGDFVDVTPLKNFDRSTFFMANVTLLLSEGIIDHYEGEQEVLDIPGVLHIHKSYVEGTLIDSSFMGKLSQVGMRVLLYADSKEILISKMDQVKNKLKIFSTKGNNMVLDNFSYYELCQL